MVQITPISLSHMLHVWYIYLQHWVIVGANVGKYSSTMEHMGMVYGRYIDILTMVYKPTFT